MGYEVDILISKFMKFDTKMDTKSYKWEYVGEGHNYEAASYNYR